LCIAGRHKPANCHENRSEKLHMKGHRALNRVVSLVIALALLMETIDATVLTTALPVIAADINAPVLSLKLALTTYLIALVAFVPVSGWVADRYGAKPVFLAAMAVFVAGSVLCALQTSLGGLILARAVQGTGGAMMVPVGRLIVLKSVSKSELVGALAYVTVPSLIGPALGPVLGAVLTGSLGWQSIFLVNVPLGLVTICLAFWLLPNVREERVPRFDWPGSILSAAGVGFFMFGVASAGGHVISSALAAALSVAGLLILIAYFRRAKTRSDALLDPRLFAQRTFTAGVIGGALFRTSGGAVSFLLPLLFQLGFGLSVLASGALSALYALGGLAMRMLGPRVIDAFGFRLTLLVGGTSSIALTAAFATVSRLDYGILVPLLIAAGLAQALVFAAVNGIAFADVSEARMSHATSMSAVTQQAALAIGIATAAYVLQLGGDPAPHAAPSIAHFAIPFLVVAALSSLSLPFFFRVRTADGASLRHREHIVRHLWH
jgi:EmrB/QacA subfamily drug resistance transporter